jgi:hypothetical protein
MPPGNSTGLKTDTSRHSRQLPQKRARRPQQVSAGTPSAAGAAVTIRRYGVTLTDQNYNGDHGVAIYRTVSVAGGALKSAGVTVLGYKDSALGGGPQPFFVGSKNTPVNNKLSKVVIDYVPSYSENNSAERVLPLQKRCAIPLFPNIFQRLWTSG